MKGGRNRRGRAIDGILLLDKSIGFSSNTALQCAKQLFNVRKAGHTGNLDRLASGLLPICFGEATKLSAFLLDADKRYQAVLRLGVVTTTGDAEGEVVAIHEVPSFKLTQIEEVLRRFTGPINQIPPMFSAIKYQGQRLYQLAHRGISVERHARSVTIHELKLIDYNGGDRRIEVYVACSKGTYIRTLAEDIGSVLGCGAHISALRRIGVGPYDIHQAIDLPGLEALAHEGTAPLDARLLSADSGLIDKPAVSLSNAVSYYLCQGHAVRVPHAPSNGLVRIYNAERQFLGVGEVLDDGRIAPRRLMKKA
jgi:tRNA pseudouridine55 synthase